MADKDIVNRALGRIGAKVTITNLIAERSSEADQARLFYAPTRDALLRAAHWDFARKTGYLTLRKSAPGTPENPTLATTWDPATMPQPPWLYQYAYPNDSALVRYIQSVNATGPLPQPIFPYNNLVPFPAGTPRWKWERALDTDSGVQVAVLLTDARTAFATYTVRVENDQLWDAMFQEAMVLSLAVQLCMPLTGNIKLRESLVTEARGTVRQAQAMNGNEGTGQINHVPDWIAARGLESGAGPGACAPFFMPGFLV